MTKSISKRQYDSTSRRKAADSTRQSILDAARHIFLEKGYAATTMPAIAQSAGIALDTVYAVVGKKPALFRLLVELAISGSDTAIPAEERDYVLAIRAEPDAAKKLRIYAAALREMQPRLAPLIRVLQGAATMDPELDELWRGISQRRANNMLRLAEELSKTGSLRKGLSLQKVADILWSMNSPEFYLLLVEQRGWTSQEFEHWLGQTWILLLLDQPSAHHPAS